MEKQMDSLQSKPTNVDYPVDLIRTIAIIMVVLVHASYFPYSIPGTITPMVMVNWFTADVYGAIGYLGVPIFVMLSGALLLDPAKTDEPMGVFFKRRFNRIGVPLIFWTVLFFIWSFNVHGTPFTLFNIGQGLLSGAYPTFWFLYLLVGLYLVTPIMRILVKHIDRKKFAFLLVVWFAGTVAIPLIHTFTAFDYYPVMFVFTDWAGYFLLGVYLLNTKMRRSINYLALALGLLVAIVGDWLLTATAGETATGFFHGYLSFNMIIASAALFLILVGIPRTRVESGNGVVNRVIHWVGRNTLPIYLVHIIVLESLQLGLLGFTLPYTYNLIVDVPFIAFVTFVLTVAIVYPLKKIPYLNRLIG
jgi:surface polysaccharide O-acyltransferase-like enzyme